MVACYCASFSVTCDLQQCNVLSLRSEICKKQKSLLMLALLVKPLHSQYFSFVNSDMVNKQSGFNWVRQHLHSETEYTILAVQDQVIATWVIEAEVMHKSIPSLMCRVCSSAEETIVHLLAAFPTLSTAAYLLWFIGIWWSFTLFSNAADHNIVISLCQWLNLPLPRYYGISDWLQLLTNSVIALTLYSIIFASKRYSLLRFLTQQTLMFLLKRIEILINIAPW